MSNIDTSILHQAVINDDVNLVSQLSSSELRFAIDQQGFTPLELAQLLGRKQCQLYLGAYYPTSLKVQFENQVSPESLSLNQFEEAFDIIYRPFLTFGSYTELLRVVRQCPFLFRFKGIAEFYNKYLPQISNGMIANTYIKWIDPMMGYGLFAAEDLPANTFVAEYTGLIREINKKMPTLNPYCFQYPNRLFSFTSYAIDSFKEGNIGRFINHQDSPNLLLHWVVKNRLLHLVFVTKEAIAKDSELSFDYGKDYWLHRTKR